MPSILPLPTPPRYIVGIDLGTTNSAVAYVDTSDAVWAVRDFAITQLIAPGMTEPRAVLPSFLYEAGPFEFPPGALRLPWKQSDSPDIIGLFAREHGSATPGRLVTSAKSWLSHSGVDRTAPLLPWHGALDVEKRSPVQISALYLGHIRAAWDHAFGQHPLAQQDVALTVPASFDEVARELTLQAARDAGLVKVVLVEEPQAVFYAWIDSRGDDWDRGVRPGQTILVCDVGGGTSDFTLIRVRAAADGKVLFHRVAVGEHLILGGDNLDLALAHFVEQKLPGGGSLSPHQWGALVGVCRVAKETLLGPDAPEKQTITLTGAGTRLVGSAMSIDLSREQAHEVLVEGFFPRTSLDARPIARRSGFQEFGLPYAPDAAITRYLAAFLSAHRQLAVENSTEPSSHRDAARPDKVLFNGGLFQSPVLRQRLIDVLEEWFNPIESAKHAATPATQRWHPDILRNDRLDLAVARGAAYYGTVRRGRGVRISGGLAHSYYVGVQSTIGGDMAALCLLPAGIEEGQTVDMTERTLDLLIRQPAEFPLFYSATRTTDRPGALLPLNPEQLTALPPIRTVLQSGRKSGADTVPVHLHARLTEIGTLEIWCQEVNGERQWKLQFDVRAATRADAARHGGEAESAGVVEEAVIARCRDLIRAAFAKPLQGAGQGPAGVVKRLEQASGTERGDWPPSLMRSLWETLIGIEPARRISIEHEARWLSLTGYCLRPGYGLAVDDWRIGQMWRLYPAGVYFPKNELCRAEWWILWRRLAGGLTAGQQAMLADPLLADWRTWLRKSGSGVRGRSATFQFGPHESAEVWRLLGALELLKPMLKSEIAGIVFERLAREKAPAGRDALLFCLGRLGARVPVYGPLNALAEVGAVEQWTDRLMAMNPADERASFALVQLTRRTGDRYRDVSQAIRQAALQWLTARNAPPHLLDLIRHGGHLQAEEQRVVFGETLPRGLRIE